MKIVELTDSIVIAAGSGTFNAANKHVGFVEKVVVPWVDSAATMDVAITEEGVVSQPILTITDAGTGTDYTFYPKAESVNVSNTVTGTAQKIFVTEKLRATVTQAGTSTPRFLVYISDEP